MTNFAASQLVLAYASMARIEAMKVFNAERLANGLAPGYDEQAFGAEADQLERISQNILNAPTND